MSERETTEPAFQDAATNQPLTEKQIAALVEKARAAAGENNYGTSFGFPSPGGEE